MKIIKSNTSHGAYQAVVAQLKANLNSSTQNIVIAPDRFTASVERGLIVELGIEGSFGIDVMSFTRLANKLIGDDIKKCLTPEGSVMLIGKVIADCRENLQYYGKVAMADGFASELYAALTAIRNSGISSAKLLENEVVLSPSMRAKLKDIALIYDGYLNALEGKHSDSSTRLYTLAQFINDNPSCVATTNFYCTDIYDFSQPEMEILRGIAKNALSLTIGVTSGYDNQNKRIYPDRIISSLKKLSPDKVEIVDNIEQLDEATSAISTKLFAYINADDNQKAQNNGKVKLRVAKDRYDEVMSLVVDICKWVRNGGRYKDFEVYASDIEDYADELKSAFLRYNIPFFIDKQELLSEQTKVRYILDAIACVRSGFRKREVFDFVKNPLFASQIEGGMDSVFLFENYCLKYNIDYSRFLNEFKLKDEFNGEISQKQYFSCTKCDDKVYVSQKVAEDVIPEKVRAFMKKLLKAIPFDTANIKVFVDAIRGMLKGIETPWQVHVDKLSSMSEYYKKCAEQVDNKLNAVLDEIEDVLDFDLDILGFENIFKSMLKTLKIALVPTFLDCVFVGDQKSRFGGGCHIYVLGANSGKVPCVSSGGVVITPKDEQVLSAVGIELTPCEKQKVMTNMYAICDLMKKPKGKLVVSYAECGEQGALRPSTVVFELQNMLFENGRPLDIERVDFDNLSGMDLEDIAMLFSTEHGCYHEVLRNSVSKRARLEDGKIYASAFEYIDEQDKKRIEKIFEKPERIALGDKLYFEDRTSVSRLETFYRCPYQHYFNYILSLRPRKDGKFQGTENGTILHFVLEKFFCDLRDRKIKKDEIEQKANEYFDLAIKENNFAPLLEKEDTGRLLLRTKNEGVQLCKDMFEVQKHSKFVPTLLEAKIGDGYIKPMSLSIGDKQIQLKGTIDRVDILDDKFLIIDYKTYKSADLSFKELYYGEKVQLYVYMRAIENSINARPSGVFYLPIFSGFTTDETSRYKLKGQASDSIEVLQNIDDRALQGDGQSIVPYKADTKGKMSASVHLSSNDMDMLGDYAIAIASKGAEEIANGYIKPVPIKEQCQRCDFASICAYKGCNERKLGSVKDISAFDINAQSDCAESGDIE